jgi:predicted phosphoribosyltransferase
MFRDRVAAGLLLAEKLRKFRNEPGIILAVPRGGIPVAYAVAKKLGLPMDLLLTKKIGHPLNKEYAIGAANLTDHFIIPHENVSDEYIQRELLLIRRKLKDMYQRYMGDKEPASLDGRTVIIIDDGMATGNTIIGTVSLLRKSNPGKIIIAVPVASDSAVEKLRSLVDEVITVYIPDYFTGVGAFYDNFEQVTDDEVLWYLNKLKNLQDH